MTGTPALWLCMIVLAHPVALWRLTRRPGEGPRRWFRRYEPLDWFGMHRDVLNRRWVSPVWWLKYLFGVTIATSAVPWCTALFVLVSGQWRHANAASEMAQLWIELTLIFTIPLFMRIMQSCQPQPTTLSWALVGRCGQIALYDLAVFQVYAACVATPQLTGLNRLVLWR